MDAYAKLAKMASLILALVVLWIGLAAVTEALGLLVVSRVSALCGALLTGGFGIAWLRLLRRAEGEPKDRTKKAYGRHRSRRRLPRSTDSRKGG